MAKASDARLASGRGRRAGRHSARHQGPVRAPRASTPRPAATSSTASSRATNRPSPPICGPTARSCSASSTWTSSPWARPTRPPTTARSINPWRARNGLRTHAVSVPGGSVRAARPQPSPRISVRRRHRDRHRRLDPPAGRLHRHRRHQADLWPLLALGHRRLRLLARPGRPDRPRRARRRDPAEVDGLASIPRTRPPSTCRCRTTRRRSASRSRA